MCLAYVMCKMSIKFTRCTRRLSMKIDITRERTLLARAYFSSQRRGQTRLGRNVSWINHSPSHSHSLRHGGQHRLRELSSRRSVGGNCRKLSSDDKSCCQRKHTVAHVWGQHGRRSRGGGERGE